jgi:hypothetical protein
LAKGDKRQLFQDAYYGDPENHTNRGWTASGERNGPGIVQQYFLSSAVIPTLLIGGLYNPVGGHNWAKHWVWRRSSILELKKIHRSIRKFYPRKGTEWESEKEGSDADDDMDVDVEPIAGVESGVTPALLNVARGAKRRGRPGGSKNKKGKKETMVPEAVLAQPGDPSRSNGGMVPEEAPTDDAAGRSDAEEHDGSVIEPIRETPIMISSHIGQGGDMDICRPNTEEWVTVTTENAHLLMDI